MRRYVMPCIGMLSLLAAGGAFAATGNGHHLQCNYHSDYDVQVQPAGIVFTRSEGHPARIFMHGGQLRIDDSDVAISADDAVRLRAYEQQVRELVPAIAAIVRDGVDIGYAALSTVVATLSDNGDERQRMLASLHDRRDEAMHGIDSTLGQGMWSDNDDELFDRDLEKVVDDLVGGLAGSAVSDALSGDPNRVAALEARAKALDATLDKAVQEPAEKLGERAEALCPRFSALDQLQQQFRFRLSGGGRLQLLSLDMDSSYKASQYAQR
jgi:hypothetical protein